MDSDVTFFYFVTFDLPTKTSFGVRIKEPLDYELNKIVYKTRLLFNKKMVAKKRLELLTLRV